jgi:hypothetical protein
LLSFAAQADGSAARATGAYRLAGHRQAGLVLGGGHAIELHGMGDRPSEDIDLFSAERCGPAAVADDLMDAYTCAGSWSSSGSALPDLVQMEVTDAHGQGCKV